MLRILKHELNSQSWENKINICLRVSTPTHTLFPNLEISLQKLWCNKIEMQYYDLMEKKV